MICVHFWRIAIPEGPTSKGVCLKCREEREFVNSVEEYGPERRVAAHKMYSTSGKRMAEAYRE